MKKINFPLNHEIENYGCTTFQAGGVILVNLPTRTIALDELYPDNWPLNFRDRSWGHFRFVHPIGHLANGEKMDKWILAKSPERVFTTSQCQLKAGNFWWGGDRSGEGHALIPSNPVVEEQVLWEALFLLECKKRGIRAEVPQVILVYPDGEYQLVVGGLDFDNSSTHRGLGSLELLDEIEGWDGFEPHDALNNVFKDREGFLNVIDVNRWEWKPLTNDFHNRLLEVVKKKAKRK